MPLLSIAEMDAHRAPGFAAGKANAEFYGIMVLALVNIVAFFRLGELGGGIVLAVSVAAFFLRSRIISALQQRLRH